MIVIETSLMLDLERTLPSSHVKPIALLYSFPPMTPLTFVTFSKPIDFSHVNVQIKFNVELEIVSKILITGFTTWTKDVYANILNHLMCYGVKVNNTVIPPCVLIQHF
jgi:hypothetical protein